jgi:hypothetical protein
MEIERGKGSDQVGIERGRSRAERGGEVRDKQFKKGT